MKEEEEKKGVASRSVREREREFNFNYKKHQKIGSPLFFLWRFLKQIKHNENKWVQVSEQRK